MVIFTAIKFSLGHACSYISLTAFQVVTANATYLSSLSSYRNFLTNSFCLFAERDWLLSLPYINLMDIFPKSYKTRQTEQFSIFSSDIYLQHYIALVGIFLEEWRLMTFEGHSLNFWGYVFGSGRVMKLSLFPSSFFSFLTGVDLDQSSDIIPTF